MTASLQAPPGARMASELARAMKNTSFYDLEHPVVRTVLQDLHAEMERYLEERRELEIKFVSGYVVVDDQPLLTNRSSVGNLLGACHRRKAESLVFRRGVQEEEVEQLMLALLADPAAVEQEGGITRRLEAQGVRHISAERLTSRPSQDWQWVHSAALDVLRGAAMNMRTGSAVDVTGVRQSARDIVDDILGERAILHNLMALRGTDEYTFIHALHICVLSTELGRQINLGRSQLEELGIATLLHDVGKVLVPLEVLRKPSALTEAEFAVISRHPVDGAILLSEETDLPESTPVVAFEHHMHYDFSGYPRSPRPRRLHLFSLMASIADVYDALTTIRPYRPPLPPLRAVEIMRQECQAHLEPRLLRHFIEMLGPYPWGTLLGFHGGGLAVITRPNSADPENPFARPVRWEQGVVAAGEEAPLRALLGASGPPQVLDPVALGMDLSQVMSLPS